MNELTLADESKTCSANFTFDDFSILLSELRPSLLAEQVKKERREVSFFGRISLFGVFFFPDDFL